MRVLLVHEFYQQPGGEGVVFSRESDLLTSAGHEVERFVDHNRRVEQLSGLRLATKTFWSREAFLQIGGRVKDWKPDVVHLHNTFPLISPAAIWAARSAGAPVVQTLHNYRLHCVNALFFRDGQPCQDCLGRWSQWRGVQHRCYRSSRGASAVVAASNLFHRVIGTWSKQVDAFIVPSRFARDQIVAGGLPAGRVHVKPNPVDDPAPVEREKRPDTFLFIGRLSEEKGIRTLLRAWNLLDSPLPLRIVGDGPLRHEVEDFAAHHPHVETTGHIPPSEVRATMRSAIALVHPSVCYETMGMVVVEALSAGLPVIVAAGGAAEELVRDSGAGWLFPPTSPEALARTVARVVSQRTNWDDVQQAARGRFETHFSSGLNLRRLLDIYSLAIERFTDDPSTRQR